MPITLQLNGFDDLKYALKMLPEELTDEGGDVVRYWSRTAAGWARASYPRRSGNLQDGVAVEYESGGMGSRWGARARVVNKARHAYIYEYGTQARHYYTKRGVIHKVGAMPAAPAGRAFVPNMIRARERMYADLVELVVRHGLAVRGSYRAA